MYISGGLYECTLALITCLHCACAASISNPSRDSEKELTNQNAANQDNLQDQRSIDDNIKTLMQLSFRNNANFAVDKKFSAKGFYGSRGKKAAMSPNAFHGARGKKLSPRPYVTKQPVSPYYGFQARNTINYNRQVPQSHHLLESPTTSSANLRLDEKINGKQSENSVDLTSQPKSRKARSIIFRRPNKNRQSSKLQFKRMDANAFFANRGKRVYDMSDKSTENDRYLSLIGEYPFYDEPIKSLEPRAETPYFDYDVIDPYDYDYDVIKDYGYAEDILRDKQEKLDLLKYAVALRIAELEHERNIRSDSDQGAHVTTKRGPPSGFHAVRGR